AYRLWTRHATARKAILLEIAPRLKPLGGKLLEIAQSVVFGLLEFVASIVIAGFLYAPGPQLVDTLRAFSRRTLSDRSEEVVALAGRTIRDLCRVVFGIALVQSFLAGLGLLVAGIPAAGFFTFLALVLGIIQIGPAIVLIPIVIWSWTAMETTSALIFSIYMILVGLSDNIFR